MRAGGPARGASSPRIYITPSERFADARASLLGDPAWEASRKDTQRSRSLSFPADPAAFTAGLGVELDEAYQRTLDGLTHEHPIYDLTTGKLPDREARRARREPRADPRCPWAPCAHARTGPREWVRRRRGRRACAPRRSEARRPRSAGPWPDRRRTRCAGRAIDRELLGEVERSLGVILFVRAGRGASTLRNRSDDAAKTRTYARPLALSDGGTAALDVTVSTRQLLQATAGTLLAICGARWSSPSWSAASFGDC